MLESVEELDELLVDERVVAQRPHVGHPLGGSREFAVEQEKADVGHVRAHSELLDSIPAIQEHSFFTIGVRDAARAGRCRGEAGIEGTDARLRLKLADVQEGWGMEKKWGTERKTR